ncbi:MAG: L,D-transpeptidase family protein [Lentisphaeria bacterium]|nr:L,D-transpeptidase family protein [Lentisphaeria bacterium]
MPRFEYQYDRQINDNGRKLKHRLRLLGIFLLISAVTAGVIYLLVPKGGGKKVDDPAAQKPTTEKVSSAENPQQSQPENNGNTAAASGETGSKENTSASNGNEKTPETPETPIVSGQGQDIPAFDPAKDPILSGTAAPEKGKVWVGDPVNDVPEKSAAKNDVSVLDELKSLADKKDFVQLNSKALEIISRENEGSDVYRTAAKYLLEAKKSLLLSQDGVPGVTFVYSVRGGDSLSRIARRNSATVAGLMRFNQLKNGRIFVGSNLRINKGPWQISVSKSKRLLKLLNGKDNSLFAVFEVGVGRLNSTPTGGFVISSRIKDPRWHAPDGSIFEPGEQGNELGKYFLKLAATGNPGRPLAGYGIHGTPDESTVGKSVSSGCIRMKNADVELLYELVPEGTPVIITD